MTAATTDAPRRLIDRRPRIRLAFLMLLVALAGVVAWAYRFRAEFGDTGRYFLGNQLAALSAREPKARRDAAETLGNIGSENLAAVLPRLLDAASDPDPAVRRAAVRSLAACVRGVARARDGKMDAEIDAITPALLAALRDPDPLVRAEAAAGLALLCDEVYLTDPTTGLTRAVRITPDPAVAVPALERAAGDGDGEVRSQAVRALGRIAPKAGDAPSLLLDLLTNDPEAKVRSEAARALTQPWKNAPLLWSPLVARMVAAPKDAGSANLGWTLNGLGPTPPAMLPELIDAIRSDGWPVRRAVPAALGHFGPRARAALPQLLVIARDQLDEGETGIAAEAIARIGPTSPEARILLDLVAARIAKKGPHEVEIDSLAKAFGPAAAPLVPHLIPFVEGITARGPTGGITCDALALIGPKAAAALPALAKAACDGPRLRSTRAALAILAIDPKSPEAAALARPLARMMLEGPLALSRWASIQLPRVGPLPPALVAELRKAAQGERSLERDAAAKVLEYHDVNDEPAPESP